MTIEGDNKLTVGGNWKLRPFENEGAARVKAAEFKAKFESLKEGVGIILFVQDKWARAISEELKGSNIKVGVQSYFFNPDNPIEPQIETAVLNGAEYAMVGHSMHRYPDPKVLPGVAPLTNEGANKIAKTIMQDRRLKLWYVIGVNEDSNKSFSEQEDYLKKQIDDGITVGLKDFAKFPKDELVNNLIITVEPTADISTKAGDGWIDPKTKVNFPKVEMLMRLLTEAVQREFGEAGKEINTGYGATAGPDTAELLLSQPNIFNILPGGKSLEANDFYGTVVNAIKGKYDH